jgi:hypothetical protein
VESESAPPQADTSTPEEEEESASDALASLPMETQAPPQGEETQRGARVQSPSPPADNTPALLDAIARMKLDVFVYADVQDKRMVVIDGRRYVEGDQVAGRFLLEAITSEGVVLSHGGAKAILRP